MKKLLVTGSFLSFFALSEKEGFTESQAYGTHSDNYITVHAAITSFEHLPYLFRNNGGMFAISQQQAEHRAQRARRKQPHIK